MQARLLSSAEILHFAERWEHLVQTNPASGFMQSHAWARFKRTQKLLPVYVGLFRNHGAGSHQPDLESLIGGAIFYLVEGNKGAGFMVAPDGPVLPWHSENDWRPGLNAIVSCAENYARQNGQIALRIQPRLLPPALAAEYEFGRAPVDLTPRETLFLDLRESPENLLASMKPKTRYNIRISSRHGVRVFEDYSDEGIAIFHRLLLEAAARDGFYVEPLSFFRDLVEQLKQAHMLRLFFAEHEGEVVGALCMVHYGGRATYLYGGIINRKRNVMPGYALQWHAIQEAQRAGALEYDFYGFDTFGNPESTYARFSRFKRGFGGSPVRYVGAQDCFFLDSLVDVVIRAVGEVDWNDDDEIDDEEIFAGSDRLAMSAPSRKRAVNGGLY